MRSDIIFVFIIDKKLKDSCFNDEETMSTVTSFIQKLTLFNLTLKHMISNILKLFFG